jgi:hypothetical protein
MTREELLTRCEQYILDNWCDRAELDLEMQEIYDSERESFLDGAMFAYDLFRGRN